MPPVRAARLLFQLPGKCRVFTAIYPSNQWGFSEVFANKTNYLLETLLWQNSYDPKKKAQHEAKRPKPFIPDFMKPPTNPSPINNGSELHTTDEVRDILSMPRG